MMKLLVLYIVCAGISFNISGEQILNCIPPEKPNADVISWVPEQTNLPLLKNGALYNGQGYGILKKEKGKKYYAEFELPIKKSGNYMVFAALSQPNRSYTSKIKFSFNGSVLQDLKLNARNIPKWGVHKLMSWIPLGKFKLSSKGKNTFRFEVNAPRRMDGNYVFYCNGVAAFNLDQKVVLSLNDWSVLPHIPKKGRNIKLKFTYKSDSSTDLEIKVLWEGKYLSLSKRVSLKKGKAIIEFPIFIAEDWPDGKYEVTVKPFVTQTVSGQKNIFFQVGKSAVRKVHNSFKVNTNGAEWEVTLLRKLSSTATLGVWGFDVHGNLMATAKFQLSPDVLTMKFKKPNTNRWQNFKSGKLNFHINGSSIKSVIKNYNATNIRPSKKFKPMSHGTYNQKDGTNHYWSVNDKHEMIWDDKAWIPMGGMFVPHILRWPRLDSSKRAKQWIIDRKCLDDLAKYRHFDMYINSKINISPWLRQMVVDEFNRRNIKFGCQITTGSKPVSGYNIYSSVTQGLLTAECKEPEILELKLPNKENIESILLIPQNGVEKVRNIPLNINSRNNDKGLYIIQDRKTGKKTDNFLVLKKKITGIKPGKYYVMPKISLNKKRVSDVWSQLDKTKAELKWVKDINWGDGLRFFVDPICGEGGFNNSYEVFRVWSKPFNHEFATWLKNKYGTLTALNKSWALSPDTVKSFATAACLIPLRNLDDKSFDNSILLFDPLRGNIYRTINSPGTSWLDYITAVRYTYGVKRNEIAAFLKKMVDVPVVFKRVSPWVNIEGINYNAKGFDGLGLELYPQKTRAGGVGLFSGKAEVDASLKTIWFLGTELGYSAKVGNWKVRGWPDKQYLHKILFDTARAGAKGFFLFALKVPKGLWYNHNLCEMPDRLQWVVEEFSELEKNWPETVKYALCYPSGSSWWWRSNGIFHNRYNCVYRNAPTEFVTSVMLKHKGGKELWAAASTVALNNVDLVVTNLKNDFYVGAYAKQLQKYLDTKKMLYLGFWPKTRHLPQLGKHFTDKIVKLADGSAFQALKVFDNDIILASSKDDVWAKISNNVMIISRDPKAELKKNKFQIPDFVKTEWLDKFNIQISVAQ